MKNQLITAAALVVQLATAARISDSEDLALEKRQAFEDSYKIFLRKRNAHACMMSIVFIVLLPLAAISLHLPLRGIRVVPFIHAPIQTLGLAMMIGAMGLGIDIANNDLHYISPVKAHVVIGLLTTSMLILFQPALGIWQHVHYNRTGRKSVFAYAHRWLGRVAILLGWINTALGFQLVPLELVATHTLVREYVIMGVLGGLWFLLLSVDGIRNHFLKKQKISTFALRWNRGLKITTEETETEEIKEADRSDSSRSAPA